MQPLVPKIKMPGTSRMQMPSQIPNVTLNPASFDDFIKSQGVRMAHQRPVPCPSIRDINAPQHDARCPHCYNGLVYYDYREFVGAVSGIDMNRNFGPNGTWDLTNAALIVPLTDKDGKRMDLSFFDQIMLLDYTIRYYQRVEHSQSGLDRMQFPVESVDFIIDEDGKIYNPEADITIENGRVKWLQNRPGYDPVLQRGRIYSINYYTKPTFTVIGLPHQLRSAQTKDYAGGANIQANFPQLVIVRRDFIPHDHSDDVGDSDRPEPKRGTM